MPGSAAIWLRIETPSTVKTARVRRQRTTTRQCQVNSPQSKKNTSLIFYRRKGERSRKWKFTKQLEFFSVFVFLCDFFRAFLLSNNDFPSHVLYMKSCAPTGTKFRGSYCVRLMCLYKMCDCEESCKSLADINGKSVSFQTSFCLCLVILLKTPPIWQYFNLFISCRHATGNTETQQQPRLVRNFNKFRIARGMFCSIKRKR